MRVHSMMTIGIALLALGATAASACPRQERRAAAAPFLIDGGVTPPHFEGGEWKAAELWLRVTDDAPSDLFHIERIGGDDPRALAPVWAQDVVMADDDGVIRVPLAADVAVPPFGVGIAVHALPRDARAVDQMWLTNVNGSAAPRGDTSETVVFFVLAAFLAVVAVAFQRTQDPESRVRLAAAAALASSIILLATSGMPWMQSVVAGVECRLGQEAVCAGPPLAALDAPHSGMALFDFERWRASADAIRLAQLMTFAMLLPALIWLLVEPRARAAQATAAVGATIASFGLLAVAFYRGTMPGWMVADLYATFDLAILAASAVVIAVVAIVRQIFVLGSAPPLARAIARR